MKFFAVGWGGLLFVDGKKCFVGCTYFRSRIENEYL
jgi:hypothetical protein